MSILPKIHRAYLTYGFDEHNDYRAQSVVSEDLCMHFEVTRPHPHSRLTIKLACVGRHNVLNALAAIAVATEEGVSDEAIISAMSQFRGVGRRFEVYPERVIGDETVFTLVDDYGHHPREISVVLEAARCAWPDRRIVMLFEPHRYTRTQDLFDDFVCTLATTDSLLLLDVYAAGEAPIEGVDSLALCRAIELKTPVKPVHITNTDDLLRKIKPYLKTGDVLITQGAGKIGQITQRLLEQCPQKETEPVSA